MMIFLPSPHSRTAPSAIDMPGEKRLAWQGPMAGRAGGDHRGGVTLHSILLRYRSRHAAPAPAVHHGERHADRGDEHGAGRSWHETPARTRNLGPALDPGARALLAYRTSTQLPGESPPRGGGGARRHRDRRLTPSLLDRGHRRVPTRLTASAD